MVKSNSGYFIDNTIFFKNKGIFNYYIGSNEAGYVHFKFNLKKNISFGLEKYKSELHIDYLFVFPKFRNKGISKIILNKVIEYAEKNGIEVISLRRDSNNRCDYGGEYDNYLKKVYSSVGFNEIWKKEEADLIENANPCYMYLDLKKTKKMEKYEIGGRLIIDHDKLLNTPVVIFQSGEKRYYSYEELLNFLNEELGNYVVNNNDPVLIESMLLTISDIKDKMESRYNEDGGTLSSGGEIGIASMYLNDNRTQVETILESDVNFDTPKKLNRSDIKVSDDIIKEIEEKGMSIERLEDLKLPIFKYQTQITVHGDFEGLEKQRVGFGYKNLFLNQNKSLGIKYNAIDAEKKEIIRKSLKLNNSYNKDKKYSFSTNIDSKGFDIVHRVSTKLKEEAINLQIKMKEFAKQVPDIFIGKKNVYTYYIPFLGMYVIELDIKLNAIYDKNLFKLISFLTDGFINNKSDYDIYVNEEEKKYQEYRENLKKEKEEKLKNDEILLNEFKSKVNYPVISELPSLNEYAIGRVTFKHSDKPVMEVMYISKSRGRTLFHTVDYYELSDIPDRMVESRYSKKDIKSISKILSERLKKGNVYLIYKPEEKKTFEEIEKSNKVTIPTIGTSLIMSQDKHSKTGEKLDVVKISGNLERDNFLKLQTRVKNIGGYYSSFVKGFIVKRKLTDEELKDLGNGIVSSEPEITTEPEDVQEKALNITNNENEWDRVFIVHKDDKPVSDFDYLNEASALELYNKFKDDSNTEIITWEKRAKNKYGHITLVKTVNMKINKDEEILKEEDTNEKMSLEEAKEKYPIVLEWSEGSIEENKGFNNLDEVQEFLSNFNIPKNGYIKNKFYFKGLVGWYNDGSERVDISDSESDFNPNKMHIKDYLKKEYPNYNFEPTESIKGGLSDNKTESDIAKIHNVSVERVREEIEKGKKVESEHTDDVNKQEEIAKDHIIEDIDYYNKLEKMESGKTDELLNDLKEQLSVLKSLLDDDKDNIEVLEQIQTIEFLISDYEN